MKKAIAIRWAKALRSGKYAQGNNYLCEYNGRTPYHNCLGVLTDLYQQECMAKKKKGLYESEHYVDPALHYGYSFLVIGYGPNHEPKQLTNAVMRWAGIKNTEDVSKYKSWKALANFIEKNYKEI